MARPTPAAAAAGSTLLQLKYICVMLCLTALGPMLRYYFEHFRILDWPIEVSGFPVGRDFVNLWSGGRAAWSGHYDLLFDAKKYALELQHLIHPSIVENGLVWSYPPTAFWLGVPFAGLPFYAALPIWLLLGLTTSAWAFLLDGGAKTPRWALPWLVLSPGVLMVLYFAQTGLVTTGIFIGGLLLARKRPLVAGALLATFVVKPHMGMALPVVLLALRYWKAFAATAAFSVIYVLATLAAFGWEPWDLYLHVTLPKHLGLLTPWGRVLPWMFTAQYFPLLASGLSETLAMRLHWVTAAITLAALAWTLPRVKDQNLQIALAGAATMLVSPYMQAYELVLPTLAALRAAAYAPPPAEDRYLTLRWFVVIMCLMAPVIGLLVTGLTGVNPVALLMLAVVGGGAFSVRPSTNERQAWILAIRSGLSGLRLHERRS